jgi:pimeloyl-ACP methyl ester carboxylesterase
MPYVSVNDIQLYYEEHGKGAPLVLVHGFSASGRIWDDFISAFTPNYRVIVPDLRGHGKSTGHPATIHHQCFASDLLALLDHLKIRSAHFVGHSSGGMSLLFIGRDCPDRATSLVLVSATYTFDEHAKRHMQKVAGELDLQPEAIAESSRIHGATHGEGYWRVLRDVFLAFTENPEELPFRPQDLAEIPVPCLVLHGDRDEFFPIYIPVTMYQSLPHAELCILPNTAHGLPKEQPRLFLEVVTSYLDRVDKRVG